MEKATYPGSCSALTRQGRQTNMDEAEERASKTEQVFSDHWKLTIYRPEWPICLLGPRDAQTRSELTLAKHKHTYSVQCEG